MPSTKSKGPNTKDKNKVSKKSAPKKVVASSGPRRLLAPKKVWYQPLTWRNRQPVPSGRHALPKARHIFARTAKQLWVHKRLFGGIVLIYGLLNILLVRGLSGSSNLSTLKSTLDSVLTGVGGKVASSFTTFAYLLSTSGSGNTAVSGVYQTILLLICSLAFIWALRQITAKHVVRTRESFYQGMYPLVPFLLVLLFMGVQLLPLAIGGGLYNTVISNGIAVQVWEKLLWGLLFFGLALWSLRMITGSIFALYIVTLPDMTPMKALRSAKQLVYARRLLIWRKLIFLPIVLLLIAIVVELPLILFATFAAVWVFFILSMAVLAVVHGYLYNLYRELL
jgi:hypothetical protein